MNGHDDKAKESIEQKEKETKKAPIKKLRSMLPGLWRTTKGMYAIPNLITKFHCDACFCSATLTRTDQNNRNELIPDPNILARNSHHKGEIS